MPGGSSCGFTCSEQQVWTTSREGFYTQRGRSNLHTSTTHSQTEGCEGGKIWFLLCSINSKLLFTRYFLHRTKLGKPLKKKSQPLPLKKKKICFKCVLS